MDLVGKMEALQRKSLLALILCARLRSHPETHTTDKIKLEVRPATVGRGGWWQDIGTPGLIPPTPKGIMEPYKGVEQGCSQVCTAARLSNPRADHGGTGCSVLPHTIPGGESRLLQ